MKFWNELKSNQEAIIDLSRKTSYTYQEINILAEKFANDINQFPTKSLGFVLCQNSIGCIVGYLGALKNESTVCMLPDQLSSELLGRLIDNYRPEWIWYPGNIMLNFDHYSASQSYLGYNLLISRAVSNDDGELHPSLGLMLSTSGTTGNPKMIRLSYDNITSNAQSILQYLNIPSTDRAITTLPINYSYGLSIINTSLSAGSTIILNNQNVLSLEFWNNFKKHEVTSMAGVPYTYQMLHRLNFSDKNLPSLKIMTQAGGRLDSAMQSYFTHAAKEKKFDFYIMYGQTEATARISYLHTNQFPNKLGTIGIPIPGGKLVIDEDEQLIYHGHNVMMGYAHSRMDLSKGNELDGRLATGDLATVDQDGFYSIKGRINRFIKLFGVRVNMDDIERCLERKIPLACYCIGTEDRLMIITTESIHSDNIKNTLFQAYKIPPTSVEVLTLDEIPTLATGKIDYKALMMLHPDQKVHNS